MKPPDGTKPNRIKKTVRENGETYRRLLEFSPECIAIHRDGKWVYINPAGIRLFGASSPEDVIGRSVLDFVHPDYRRIVKNRIKRQLGEGKAAPLIEEKLLRLDGTAFEAEVTGMPIADDGRTASLIIARDISARKQAESSLQSSEKRYQALIENSNDAIFIADAETGYIVEVNHRAEALMGLPRQKLVGMHQSMLHPPEDAEAYRDRFKTRVISGEIVNDDIVLQHNDGHKIPVNVSASRIEVEGRVLIQGVFRDITGRKQAEEEKQRNLEIFEAISRALSTFIAEADSRTIFSGMLESLLSITGSEYGFIGEVLHKEGNAPYLKTHAISDIAWNEETHRLYEKHASSGMEFHNLNTLFGAVMRTGAPVVSNDPANDLRSGGLPKGHPPINTFLGMPFILDGKMVGMVGLANRPDGFDASTQKLLNPLLQVCANIIGALRNDQYRRSAEAELNGKIHELEQSEQRFRQLAENIHEVFWITTPDMSRVIYISPSYEAIWGRSCESLYAAPRDWLEAIHADDRKRVLEAATNQLSRSEYDEEYRIVRPDGAIRWIRDRAFPVRDESGEVYRIAGIADDITEIIQARRLEKLRQRLMEIILSVDSGLGDTLSHMILEVEKEIPEMRGSVLLLDEDGRHLRHGAAPSLPDAYNAAVDGIEIGPNVGSCGTAAFRGERVIVSDIATDPLWKAYRELALSHGLAACWSEPILEESGKVLGTFAMYYREPRSPRPFELNVIELTGGLASIAIERRHAAKDQRLAASVFQESPLGIIITDEKANILRVNQAFTDITGYTAEEATGKNPRLLQSGRHDEGFYQNLWTSLNETGCWEGEIWNRRKNGDVYPQWESIAAVRNERGEVSHYIASFTDITEKKLSEKHVYRLAHYDVLTNLPNRTLLSDRLNQAIAQAKRRGRKVAVLFFDLDDFKLINDTMGHSAGDVLLQLIAGNLKASVRDEDTVARLGGDEFVAVLSDITSTRDVMVVAKKILAAMQQPLPLEGRKVDVSFSLGVSLFPDDGVDPETLLKHADIALYRAKHEGKNRHEFFTREMTRALEDRQRLEEELKLALEQRQFVLYYQPQIDLSSARVVGLEALIRWRHPDRGLIPPFEFISVAEDTGLILPIGRWVVEEACRQHCAWKEAAINVRVAFNLSARQLQDKGLLNMLSGVLKAFNIKPGMLELELTETCLMDDPEAAATLMRDFKNLGLGLAMDDFGTGYSSLSYLKRFAMDTLKIDQSFVSNLPDDEQDAAIATTIIAMARNLNLKVLAEGVETKEQLQFLKKHGCDEVQGYYFSKPVPADEIPPLLARTWKV